MPRNGSGTYTLPIGNPVEPNTVIEADWANTTLDDIADELTNSLSRNGNGGMLAPFRLFDGTVGAPGLGFLLETTTGIYRPTAGEMWFGVLGNGIVQMTVNGVAVPVGKALTINGTLRLNAGVASRVVFTDANKDLTTTGSVPVSQGGLGSAATPTNGQIPIGNGTNYVAATLTAGTGIAISNGAGTVTVTAANSQGLPTLTVVTGTSATAQAGFNYALTNAAATTVTLPASPNVGDLVWVTSANGRLDNVVARNGQLIYGLASDLLLSGANVQLQYVSAGYGWAQITPAGVGVEPFVTQAFGIV